MDSRDLIFPSHPGSKNEANQEKLQNQERKAEEAHGHGLVNPNNKPRIES